MRFHNILIVAALIGCAGCSHHSASLAPNPAVRFLAAQPPDSQAFLRAKGDLIACAARYRVAEAAWEEAGRPVVLQQALESFRLDLEQARSRFQTLEAALIATTPVESVTGISEDALPAGVWVHTLLMDEHGQNRAVLLGITIKLDDLDDDDGTCDLIIRRFRDEMECDGLHPGDEILALGHVIRVAELNCSTKVVRIMIREVGDPVNRTTLGR